MPVVDPLLTATPQPRHALDQLLGVPNLHVLGKQAGLDRRAAQPTRHRVAVPLHVDQAALVHATTPPLTRFQPPRRQRPQHGQLFREALTPAGVELLLQLVQEAVVLLAARTIPAAAQQQRLVHGLLETPVPLLEVAVLVAMPRLTLLPDKSVLSQQPLIALRELLPFVHLAEEHFLGRPRHGPPTPHLPLQRPQLPVGEPARVAALQLAEDGLGLQPRLLFQQRANLRPDLGERIGPRRPVMRPGQFAGQLLKPPILACRLVVHGGPRCRRGQRLARRQQPPQLPHLFVRDHRKPPCVRDLHIVYRFAADTIPAVARREI